MKLHSLVKVISIVTFIFHVAETIQAEYYYIQSDVANVRKTASKDGSIIARFRIADSFTSSKDSGEWIFVDSIDSKYGYKVPILGWINAASCTNQHVDASYIESGIKTAKTINDTIMWCERRVALEPANLQYLKALQKGYTAIGDTLRAADIGRKIRGTDPIYLAQVKDSLILLRGVIDSSGEFRSLEWMQVYNSEKKRWEFDSNLEKDKIIKKEAQQLRLAMAGLPWYQQFSNYPGWSFPQPFIFPTETMALTSEQGRINFYMDISGYSTFAVCLGKQQMDKRSSGEIFTTRPVYRVKQIGLSKRADYDSIAWFASKILLCPVDSIQIERLYYNRLPEYNFIDIAIQSTSLYDYVRVFRGIFDSKRSMVWPANSKDGQNYVYDSYYELGSPWFRFGPDTSFPAYTITPFTSNYSLISRDDQNGNFGDHLIRISKSGVKIFIVRSEYAGD